MEKYVGTIKQEGNMLHGTCPFCRQIVVSTEILFSRADADEYCNLILTQHMDECVVQAK